MMCKADEQQARHSPAGTVHPTRLAPLLFDCLTAGARGEAPELGACRGRGAGHKASFDCVPGAITIIPLL